MLPAAIYLLFAAQLIALVVLLRRLAPGRFRRPPVEPFATLFDQGTRPRPLVSVVVATLNEAHRLTPCLDGLRAQSPMMCEVLVVDSNSTDGTRALVQRAATHDARIQLVADDNPPADWVGKVWALEMGLNAASGAWVLGIDADTIPFPGLIEGVVAAAERDRLDVVSFSPQFIGQSAGERLVQPAMLTTLVYRCGAVGAQPPPPDRVLANGQCFLAKRSVLLQHGGYAAARASFSDDVTLARYLAQRGMRVGFLDGSRIYQVRSYASVWEMWREWGRSFDLKDSTPVSRRWLDVVMVWLVQALPLPLLIWIAWAWLASPANTPRAAAVWFGLLAVNGMALLVRLSLLPAMRESYAVRGWPFWLSFLADVPAAIRLTLSMLRAPRAWRGRRYGAFASTTP